MKRKTADIFLICSASALLICLGIGVLIPSNDSFSEEENRVLATLYVPKLGEIADGSFFTHLGNYYRDNFPARKAFTLSATLFELCLLRQERNGIIIGKDGYLLPKGEYEGLDLAEKNLNYLSQLDNICKVSEKPSVSAIAPRPIDIMSDKLPPLYSGDQNKLWDALNGSSADLTYLTSVIKEAYFHGEDVWYKTDHHWTTRGAYAAYEALGDKLAYTPYALNEFEPITVTESFLGSSYSAAGCFAVTSDRIELFRYEGDTELSVISDDSEKPLSLYSEEKLKTKDKYGVFLGGNYACVSVNKKSPSEERARLLIFKDSYANALVPFLARHYDLELIDLRYFQGDEKELTEKIKNADKVLFLHGADTMATTRLYP